MKKLILSLGAALLLATNSFAVDAKTESVSKEAVKKAEDKAQVGIIKEAVKAIEYTNYALININKNKIELSKLYIKKAIAELADILNRPNSPYLLPIDMKVKAYQFQGDEKTIANLIEKTRNLLEDNKVVQAREILNILRSEIDINTLNLPLATYPSALQLALKYLNENKFMEASDVLTMALNTLVETTTIIPIPIVKADYLVKEAKKIVKKDQKQAIKYLDEAKYQLKIARLLGYTSTSYNTYKTLTNEIENLEDQINQGNEVKAIFDKLIQKLEDFKEKAITTNK